MLQKKIIFPFLILLVGVSSLFAQEGTLPIEKGKKAKEMKVAFLTEELKLSEAEAENFWPIYDQYTKKKRENRKQIRNLRQVISEAENMTENEFKEATDDISDLKIKEILNNKDYINQCVAVLGVKRTILLIQSEKNFRKKIHEKRGN